MTMYHHELFNINCCVTHWTIHYVPITCISPSQIHPWSTQLNSTINVARTPLMQVTSRRSELKSWSRGWKGKIPRIPRIHPIPPLIGEGHCGEWRNFQVWPGDPTQEYTHHDLFGPNVRYVGLVLRFYYLKYFFVTINVVSRDLRVFELWVPGFPSCMIHDRVREPVCLGLLNQLVWPSP